MKFTAKTFIFLAIFSLIVISAVAQIPSNTSTTTGNPSNTDNTGTPTDPSLTEGSASTGLPSTSGGTVNGVLILIGIPAFILYKRKKKRDGAHVLETAGNE
ncbi:2843_t:CDS:2 [Diversispora eburnea]|uniref:2843_t:CDS:1 n=1 Tax=Diversispora eburnea TaxID=1213867 RepID=A0A9N9ANE2_9GLOM|nr:2843_t:CDS:2 [Diversispora eburnea]